MQIDPGFPGFISPCLGGWPGPHSLRPQPVFPPPEAASVTSLEKAPRPLGWVRAPPLPLLCPLPTPQVLWLPLPSPTDHMLAEGWPIHPPQRRAQEGLQSGVGGQAGPEHQGGGFGPVRPMELIDLFLQLGE